MEQNGPCMAYPLNVVNPDYEEAPTIPGRLPALAACPLGRVSLLA
jgi:hypothetical protein